MTPEREIKRIYLDNSASTPVDVRVLDAMEPYWVKCMGNPASLHKEGQEAKKALEEARASVAKSLHARKEQIVFTSGGTESNILALQGTFQNVLESGRKPETIHILVSEIEHGSVLEYCKVLERKGVRVGHLGVDRYGRILLDEFRKSIRPETVLVSLVHVNNEIGTIQNVEEIGKIIRQARKEYGSMYPLLHYDACQSPVWTDLYVERMHADTMTLDSQKFYGPKGVGCLFVKDTTHLTPLVSGGRQEFGLRSGTPAVPLIVGFAKALTLLEEERKTYVNTIESLKNWLVTVILEKVENAYCNSPEGKDSVAGVMSFSFEEIESEQLVIELDAHGIAVSAGSACLSESVKGSHVIKALKKGDDGKEYGTVRLSLSRHTTKEEVERAGEVLIDTIARLRRNTG